MAWKNGYYYRNRRQDGRVVSEYVGNGEVAELIAAQDEHKHQQREAVRELFRRRVAADKALQQEIDTIGEIGADVVTATLLIAGYHQHKRQWRKERNVESIEVTQSAKTSLTGAKLNALIAAVDSGEPTQAQRAELARYFDQLPGLAKLQGDVTVHVMKNLLKLLYGSDNGSRAMAAMAHIRNMMDDMGYNGAPIAEQMLIDHICVCWLRLQLAEWRHLNQTADELDTQDGAYWDNVLSAAQRRYLRASEALARLRKLNVKVQINLANQQIVTG